MAVSNFMVGVILNLAGSICINLGNNLMSLGHQDSNARHSRRISPGGGEDKGEEQVLPEDGDLAEFLDTGGAPSARWPRQPGRAGDLEGDGGAGKEAAGRGGGGGQDRGASPVQILRYESELPLSRAFLLCTRLTSCPMLPLKESAQGMFARYSKTDAKVRLCVIVDGMHEGSLTNASQDDDSQSRPTSGRRTIEKEAPEPSPVAKDGGSRDKSKVAPVDTMRLEPLVRSPISDTHLPPLSPPTAPAAAAAAAAAASNTKGQRPKRKMIPTIISSRLIEDVLTPKGGSPAPFRDPRTGRPIAIDDVGQIGQQALTRKSAEAEKPHAKHDRAKQHSKTWLLGMSMRRSPSNMASDTTLLDQALASLCAAVCSTSGRSATPHSQRWRAWSPASSSRT
eukprot:scaffold1282_cov251-Pinguiococcus_pyrenoidosus.AAC.61